jgi:hypothetical protein
MTDIPAKVDETLAAFRQHMRLNNMPIPNEGFIRWVVGRMLQIVQDQPNLPEDTTILAQVHAILIEDELQEARNAPNRPLLVTAIWAALSLGSTSSPGFSGEDIERIHAQGRSLMASALGKKSGEARRENRLIWVQHAEELALDAHSNDPTRSNEKIASYISDYWRLADVECPSHRTLTKHVADMRATNRLLQRARSLPKRTR